MTSLPSNFLSLLLIPLAPWTLERAARQARLWHCVVLGILSCSFIIAMVLGAVTAGIGEPYASLSLYIRLAVRAVVGMFFIGLLLCSLIVAVLWIDVLRKPKPTNRQRAQRCVFHLLPLVLLLPTLLWTAAFMLRSIADSSLGLGTPKPAWIMSDLTQVIAAAIGATFWLLVAPAIAIFLAVCIRHHMNSTPFPDEERMCPNCLYPLVSLPPEIPCPECGIQSSTLKTPSLK